jgi:hypothetical protein
MKEHDRTDVGDLLSIETTVHQLIKQLAMEDYAKDMMPNPGMFLWNPLDMSQPSTY